MATESTAPGDIFPKYLKAMLGHDPDGTLDD